ncbi:MAG: serine protease, partial [Acidobacteriota bacterium]|nr:serine protease [Acidobacteriota bacterium]
IPSTAMLFVSRSTSAMPAGVVIRFVFQSVMSFKFSGWYGSKTFAAPEFAKPGYSFSSKVRISLNTGAVMRRPIVALAALLFAMSTFAAETQRYIVATKRPMAGSMAGTMRELRSDVQPRAVVRFESVDGIAADHTEAEATAQAASPGVRIVEPVLERHALGMAPAAVRSQTRGAQSTPYGISLIHAPETWVGALGANINVVVVDTGIDYRHPELKNVYAGGYNFITKTDNPLDDNGHGTHVSGTIAAANNDIGVVGIAPAVRLWALKVLDSSGSGTTENVIRSVDWVIAKKKEVGGNWVMNFSLGAKRGSLVESEAFARGVDAGIVIVAAAGNDSTETAAAPVNFPGAYLGVLTVGAVDSTSGLASFSCQGPEVDLTAPGVGVLSTVPIGTGELAFVTGRQQYLGGALGGSPRGTTTGTFVSCGIGRKEDIPASVNGKIALIKRGDIRFSEKARNAKDAGAAAIVIYNNDDSAISWTLKPTDEPEFANYNYPLTVGISLEAGEALLADTQTTSLTVSSEADDYATYNGTSMATPHVTGAAALLWSLQPNFTASTIINTLTFTAKDLGATGADDKFGAGLVNVFDAAKLLSPSAFGTTPPPSGRRILKRGKH